MAEIRRSTPRLLVRVRNVWRGLGEVAAFFGAGLAAVAELCLGRWPKPSRPRPAQVETPAERVTPFPVHD
jgi:hypothetical protein